MIAKAARGSVNDTHYFAKMRSLLPKLQNPYWIRYVVREQSTLPQLLKSWWIQHFKDKVSRALATVSKTLTESEQPHVDKTNSICVYRLHWNLHVFFLLRFSPVAKHSDKFIKL